MYVDLLFYILPISFYRKIYPRHFRRWTGKVPTQGKKTTSRIKTCISRHF